MDKTLLDKMMVYCSKGERCVLEVTEKLRAAEASADDIEQIVGVLVEMNFINERRYADAFVSDKFRFNKWGRVKIAHALKQKRVDVACIERALCVIEEEAYLQTLAQLIATKQKMVKGTATQKQAAVIRFALSRGFEYDMIKRLVR
ncbi:MAG: regulatory protein RecX [Paludibacteraceae bacterium]|nr:regulatory protein RecX [Paludibacteraceae bacterium]